MRKALFAVIILATFASVSQAAVPAGKLRDLCTEKDSASVGVCAGYVAGFLDTLDGLDLHFPKGDNMEVVFADDITVGQLLRVFVKYVNEHPEVENKSANVVLVTSLIEAKLMGFKPIAGNRVDQ
jgi:hypothetical protein